MAERIENKQVEQYENAFVEPVRTNGLITSAPVYRNGTKTVKLRDVVVTRVNGLITEIVRTLYDSSGVLKETETSTIVRSNGLVQDITKVIS